VFATFDFTRYSRRWMLRRLHQHVEQRGGAMTIIAAGRGGRTRQSARRVTRVMVPVDS
jgi:hypothetical protein